jgi:signal transduction histidine kinase
VVADEGAGVAEGDEARIFLRRDGGAGIGLPLARALLEAGGGRLSLSSARPPVFEIVLPRPAETSP